MSASRRPWLLRSALMLLVPLTGCARDTALTVDSAKICSVWEQIDTTKDDKLTEGTASKIERSNIGRESFGCPYEKPRKMPVIVAQK